MSVKVTGVANFKAQMVKLKSSLHDAVDAGVFVTAQEVRTAAIKSIQEPTGSIVVTRYSQGGGTKQHVVSPAGDAPNTDTGRLVASIASERLKEGVYYIGSGLPYAAFLEFGTKYMLARPWLEPAMRLKADRLAFNIEKVVMTTIKGAT